MVKYYELLDLTSDDGPRAMINECEDGGWAKRADMEKALALIAEMRPYIRGAARLCEGGGDMQIRLCGLVARAEELLK